MLVCFSLAKKNVFPRVNIMENERRLVIENKFKQNFTKYSFESILFRQNSYIFVKIKQTFL